MSTTPPYRTSGSGPLVVLVHGTAPDLFDALEQELTNSFRVLRLDRRGFPGSGLDPVRSLSPHAEDLAAIIGREGGAAVVVGWSIGGVIALELASRFPARVRGLVLIEPPWLAKRHPTVRMVGAIAGAKLRGAFGNPGGAAERFLSWALSRRDGSCELDDMGSRDRDRIRAAGVAMLAELDGGTGEHLAPSLESLDGRATILVGDRSTKEFAAAAARLAERFGVAPEVVVGAGHAMQMTHPNVVAQAVRRVAGG